MPTQVHPFLPRPSTTLDQVLVLIPVRNEAATLGAVLQALQAQGLWQIRVVDNGSTDGSAQIAVAAGAEVIREPRMGYGQACWTGLQGIPETVEWVLFCDGDGSDDLGQLADFWALQADYDFILGDRRATPGGRATLTPVQNFGNGLATQLMGWGWGHRYGDLGPLRLIRRSALEAMQMRDRGFGWTVEMQVHAVEQGLRIAEIPVNYRLRQGGESKISGTLSGCVQAGIIILSTLAMLYGQRLGRQWQAIAQAIPPWLSGGLVVLGSLVMMPFGRSEQVLELWGGVAIAGLGFGLSWGGRSPSQVGFWGVAIAARLVLLPMLPNSDIWRYLWEGHIQNLGFSPYDIAPNATVLEPLRTAWWFRINHADVSAIYPPLTQLGFRLLASLGPSVLVFKLAFVAADLAVCALLYRRFGTHRTLIYAWNPLILYSFAGRGHYDSWFILPLVLAWFALEPRHSGSQPARSLLWGTLMLGISTAIKWVSLPLLGVILWPCIRQHQWRLSALVLLTGLLPLLLSAAPFCQLNACPLVPIDSGFVANGRSAELIPYILRLLWPASQQANWPYVLAFGGIALGLILRAGKGAMGFGAIAQSYFLALLCLSPIIHLWYFTWLVPFAIASGHLGIRWVSLSAFAYLILPYQQATLPNANWAMPLPARLILWLPLLVGIIGQWHRSPQPQPPNANL